MNFQEFELKDEEAQAFLTHVDQLVEYGLARPLAESLVRDIHAMISVGFANTITMAEKREDLAERVFIKTAFVSFAAQWAANRIFSSATAQELAIDELARRNSND